MTTISIGSGVEHAAEQLKATLEEAALVRCLDRADTQCRNRRAKERLTHHALRYLAQHNRHIK
jgi:hypothetical protein